LSLVYNFCFGFEKKKKNASFPSIYTFTLGGKKIQFPKSKSEQNNLITWYSYWKWAVKSSINLFIVTFL